MAGPIATLAVRLSAQLAEFQSTFKVASKTVDDFKGSFERSAANIQSSIDKIGKTFTSLGTVVGSLTAAVAAVTVAAAAFKVAFDAVSSVVEGIGGAIKGAIEHTADLGDSLFVLSQKTGLSVESLSAFKFVAGQTGTSLDSISGAVFKLEANLGKGAKETSAALAGIGLSLKELRAQDPADAFARIIAKLGEMPNASARAATGVAIFGKSFKDVAQLSQEDLPALIAQAKELGVVMSTETAVAADRFHDALGVLEARAEGLRLQLGAKLLPAVIAFAEAFGGILTEAFKTAGFSGQKFSEALDTTVVAVGQGAARMIEVFALLTKGIAKWSAGVISDFRDASVAFISLAESIVTVTRLVDLAQNGGQGAGLLDAISKKLEAARAGLDSLKSAAQSTAPALAKLAEGVATAAASTGDTFGAIYKRIQDEITTAADKMRRGLRSVGDGGVEGASTASDAFSAFGKQLDGLTAQINRAKQNGTPLAELVKLFGDEAAKATPKAHAWGIAVADSVEDVSRAFTRAALDKTLTKVDDQLANFFNARAEAQFKKFQASMHESAVALVALPPLLQKLDDGVVNMGASLAKVQFEKLAAGMHDSVDAVIAGIHPMRDAFEAFGNQLPDLIFGTLQHGGNLVGAIAAGLAATFAQQFQKAMQSVSGKFSDLTGGNQALGLAATGLTSFIGGYGIGAATNKTKGVLGGAASGAVAGLPLAAATGGASILIGAGIGAIGGFFGGRSADKKAKEALEQNKIALAQQYGGMQKLRDLAERLGVNIQLAFDAKKPEQFQQAVDMLNHAIETQNNRIQGLQIALTGVNQKATLFAQSFRDILDQKKNTTDPLELDALQAKLAETAQRGQAEFERLGQFVGATFAGLIKQDGDVFAALDALGPALQVLNDGVTQFGLTGTDTIGSLVGIFQQVNDEGLKPIFENLQATGQIFAGLQQGGLLTADLFQTVGTDIGAIFSQLEAKGADMSTALALSQPVLQQLWEAQQRFGSVTDDTTAKILKQAEEQGLVGEGMKDVNEKILDVLISIADVFGAKIPEALRGLSGSAQQAADDITDAFDGVSIDIPINYTPNDYRPPNPQYWPDSVPMMANGGIVRRPTLALIGEAGPEAVVPLSRLNLTRPSVGHDSPAIVFGEGSVVLQGIDGASIKSLVDSGAFAESLAKQLRTNTQGLGTAVKLAVRP